MKSLTLKHTTLRHAIFDYLAVRGWKVVPGLTDVVLRIGGNIVPLADVEAVRVLNVTGRGIPRVTRAREEDAEALQDIVRAIFAEVSPELLKHGFWGEVLGRLIVWALRHPAEFWTLYEDSASLFRRFIRLCGYRWPQETKPANNHRKPDRRRLENAAYNLTREAQDGAGREVS